MVNLPIEYPDKQVTPFGGMSLMKRFLDQTNIREQLGTLNLPQPGSNRGYAPTHVIESFSDRGDKTFFKFEDIDTTENANELKGCSLYLPKTIRPKLKRGEFYDDEVLGFQVEDKTLGLLGTITEVSPTGPNRLLTLNYNNKEVLIPVNGPFITSTNKTKKLIKVDLPEGFLDI